MAHRATARKIVKKQEGPKKQVHNRKQGKKKLAKMHAKRVGKKPKGGFKAKKPKGPSQKILKAATRIRKKCSKLSPEERGELLEGALKRINYPKN